MRISIGKPEFKKVTEQKLEANSTWVPTVDEVTIRVGGTVVTKTERDLRAEVVYGPKGPVLKGTSSMG